MEASPLVILQITSAIVDANVNFQASGFRKASTTENTGEIREASTIETITKRKFVSDRSVALLGGEMRFL